MEDQLNQPTTCRNCDAPIRESDSFCSNCGQKNTDGRITVGSLFSEFISATFNLDSKIFRTLRDLCIPGKLTIEYFKGRHKKYVHPVRLFLVSFILIAVFGILDDVIEGFNRGDRDRSGAKSLVGIQKLNSELEFRQWFYDKVYYPNRADSISCISSLDSLECNLYEYFPEDSSYRDSIRIKAYWLVDRHISTKDFLEIPSEELIDKYNIKGKTNKYLFIQQIKIKKDVNILSSYVFKNLIWVFLLMMPFLGFLLRLFSRKQEMYYVEHLIFSLHTHAFVFFGVAIMGLISICVPIFDNWYFGNLIILIAYLYFFMALKRVYEFSFWKTLFMFALLSIVYVLLFMMFFALSMFISMLII